MSSVLRRADNDTARFTTCIRRIVLSVRKAMRKFEYEHLYSSFA